MFRFSWSWGGKRRILRRRGERRAFGPIKAEMNPWYLLFIVQFVLVLWPPFYNRAEPYWIGIPFFYWYQLLCVVIGAVLTAIVYFATRRRR